MRASLLEMRAETRAGLHGTHLLLISDFNKNWNLSTHFSKTLQPLFLQPLLYYHQDAMFFKRSHYLIGP
jgi:hypothetical protein